jgi:high-affinity Fe2+/Pb2+ permease
MMVRLIIGVVVGGVLGYGLYRLVGCSSGACPITSNPWVSTIFGMVIGGLLAGGR